MIDAGWISRELVESIGTNFSVRIIGKKNPSELQRGDSRQLARTTDADSSVIVFVGTVSKLLPLGLLNNTQNWNVATQRGGGALAD